MDEELLCVFWVLDEKVSPTYLSQVMGRLRVVLMALASKSSIHSFVNKVHKGNQWPHHVPVHNTYLGV